MGGDIKFGVCEHFAATSGLAVIKWQLGNL